VIKNGIRHAMLEEPNIGVEDAKFFLLACTSFVNYLKSKNIIYACLTSGSS